MKAVVEGEAAVIAKGLSEAQRVGLMRKPGRWWFGDDPACMPHRSAIGIALAKRGLCVETATSAFRLTELGLAVREHLTTPGAEG